LKSFIHPDFLLHNDTARYLFHEVAAPLPVVDFHNHLEPLSLLPGHRFANLAQLWVNHDPYKHRAMRLNGVAEHYITGAASDQEKFMAWAKTVPKTLGNPLFHWTALELKRMFGVEEILTEATAEAIWARANAVLQSEGWDACTVLDRWNLELLCTSDDLLADLGPHGVASEGCSFTVLPSLRADSILDFDAPGFAAWLAELSEQTGKVIDSLAAYEQAVASRLDAFAAAGCRLADHAWNADFAFSRPSRTQAEAHFSCLIEGNLSPGQAQVELASYLLDFLGKAYARRGWTLQLHIGAQRYTSTRLRGLAGSSGGFAGIATATDVASICRFLDTLEQQQALPRVIFYNLNPAENAVFASLTGSFAQDGVAGKVQFGPAWWYNDHLEGIRDQLATLASHGLLSHFIGMTTDSRSLLSFSRHEYFRRILCNLVGEWVARDQLPNDRALLAPLVADLSYHNAKRWLTQINHRYVNPSQKS
jgi:glucuronate isomerase